MGVIQSVTLRRLDLPLVRPYRLSYRTFDTFEPFLVEVVDDQGRSGFADGHISPGSSSETREGGWDFLSRHANSAVGRGLDEVRTAVLDEIAKSKVAATAFVCALESLAGTDLLEIDDETVLPLLTPLNALEPGAIRAEIADWLAQGFRTFKVKVGKDVDADLERVRLIQDAADGKATLRLDANRAFSRDDGVRFAAALDPHAIELFEQPCHADDWEANAAVAAASTVPLMLDEPICALEDIERAADIPGVGFCKLKLKRFGGLQRLKEGLEAVRAHGMEPVLGDGLGSEIHSWLEACVARSTITNAGEFNGFLKPRDRLFTEPLKFEDGGLRMPAGYRPQLDRDRIERLTSDRKHFEN